MKNQFILSSLALLLGVTTGQAQIPVTRLSSVVNPKTYETISTYRLGRQSLSLGGLNQALQQAGYAGLGEQFTVVGVQSQVSSSGRSRLAFYSQFDWTVAPARELTTTNGTNTAKGYGMQFGLGVGYQMIRSERFSLAPRLMLSPAFFSLTVSKNNVAGASLSTLLVNPAAQERATVTGGSLLADLGVVGQYRFVHKVTTKQTDCHTVTDERAYVVGVDAGYRLAPDTRFGGKATADAATSVNLSGWYVALRLGFGRRYTTTTQPVN